MRAAAPAAIALLAVALYANSLHAPFLYDDTNSILTNPAIRMESLDRASLERAAFGSFLLRPVAYITFALNYRVSGYAVESYHAVNIALHVVVGWLVYALALVVLRRRDALRGRSEPGARGVALFAALFFVAHPLQTNAVTYIVQRMTSLATLFYLLALLLYALARERQRRGGGWGDRGGLALLAGALAAFGLALGSKEIAAPLPFAILLYEAFWVRDLDRAWLRRIAPWVALGTAACAIAVLLQFVGPFATQHYPYGGFTLGERLLTQLRVLVFYVSLLALPLPSRLNLIHSFETSTSLLEPPTTLVCLLVLATALATAVLAARRHRLLSFCVLWFFLHLAIESSVFPIEMAYEHRLYLPMFGVALGVAAALFRVLGARPALLLATAAAWVALLSVATVVRNHTWRSAISLWSDVAAKTDDDPRVHYNLGVAYAQEWRVEEALARFERALELVPRFPDAHFRIGAGLAAQGRLDEAIEHFRAELEIDPASSDARDALARAERLRARARGSAP